ncbi:MULTISPECIES: hypothetical protein [unclassified Duganella]|uniref:hypothetical protein n=1 Tax=unclassified Duganella TaxID=2636909 RepID=UPI0008753717|nr:MULTISPECIES: hypothetical protein [unclassified Duganella]OEZ60712.1 hypothetical protein DUGA6_29340 [Duganella sp. HH105]OFA04070.1 hypothetical protein DUGA2_23390 [Duganella sp. HH101]
MGRFLSGNSGGAGGSSATPAITTTLIAGEAVQQGDIITQGGDGLAYWATDPAKSGAGAALRPVFSQTGLTGGLTGAVSVTALTLTPQQVAYPAAAKSAVLSNGNVVHAWGCATAPWNSVFMITDATGLTLVPPTYGQANSSGGYVGLCALVGGGFVISTASQANSYNTYFTIYDNVGNVTTAATRFGSGGQVGTGSYEVMALLGLQNGNFVMVADLFGGAGQIPYMGVFTPGGATVLAAAPLAAQLSGGPASFTTSIVQLTGGGFGIAFSSGSGGPCVARYATFNAAGVQQGTTVNGRSQVSGYGQLQAVALANGNWMAAEVVSGQNPYVYVFTAAGLQLGSTNTTIDPSPGWSTQLAKPVLLSSGNVFLAYTGNSSATGVSGHVLTPAGAALISMVGGNALSTGTSGVAPVAVAYGNDSVILYSGLGATLSYLKYGNSPVGPFINTVATSSIAGNVASPVGIRVLPVTFPNQVANTMSFLIASFLPTQVVVEGHFAYRQAQTPIGVATASAAQGGAVPVQITGNATLRLGFSQPYAVDANAGSPPGQRMVVVGNQAILSGAQPPQSRRQIN